MFLTNIINAIVTFLGGALTSVAKIIPGVTQTPIYQEVENDLGAYQTLEKDYAADYADIAPFSHDGINGRVLLVKIGGSLSQYLNIS